MPSPLGHTLAGLAVDALFNPPDRRHRVQAVFFANAPDMDLLPGLLGISRNEKHGHGTHSLGAAVAAGVLVATYDGCCRGRRFGPGFAQVAAAYASHLLLDYLGKEAAIGDGMMLYWPVSRRRIASEHAWFRTIESKSKERGFVLGLFNRHNAGALLREAAVLGPVLWLAERLRRVQADELPQAT